MDTCTDDVNRLKIFQEYVEKHVIKEIEVVKDNTPVSENASYLTAARGGRGGSRGGRGRNSGRGRGQGRKVTFAPPTGWGDDDPIFDTPPDPNEDMPDENLDSSMEIDEDQGGSPKEPPPTKHRSSKKKKRIDFDLAFEQGSLDSKSDSKSKVDSKSSIVTISMKVPYGNSPRYILAQFKEYQTKHGLTNLIKAADSYSHAGTTLIELIAHDTDKDALMEKLLNLKVPIIKEKPRFPQDVNSQEFINVQPSISARLGRLLSRISPAKQSIREAILSNLDSGGVIKEKALAHEQSLRERFQYDRYGRR